MDDRGRFKFQIVFMKKLLIIGCQLLAITAMAQVTVKDTAKPAPIMVAAPAPPDTNIRVFAPALVQNMDDKLYQYQRYNHGTSPGFRVQINFGQERNAVNKTQSDFSSKYPGTTSYITYKQPYFRISVGDFRTKLEAVHFLNRVRKDYPAAFVVADKIVPPPLN
jgi:SPOR domain